MNADEWAARIRAGDVDAVAEYAQSIERQLLAYTDRHMSVGLKRKVDAADVVQEATMSAVRACEAGAVPEGDLFGWFCGLAERRIIDAHRKHFATQKRAADREVALQAGGGEADGRGGLIEMLVASFTTPSLAMARGQQEQALMRAMSELGADAQTALRLRFFDNLPSKEIADKIGKSDAATRVLLSRSLDKLQRALSQNSLFESRLKKNEGD